MKVFINIKRLFYFLTKIRLLLSILFIIQTHQTFSAQGIAVTGNWNNTNTWLFGGVNRVPACGDTLQIPVGVTVTISNQLDYRICSQNMYISVSGILNFIEGYKLDLPCSSSVVINPGGILRKGTSGFGFSTFIRICNCFAWIAFQGQVNGPQILNCSLLPVELLSFNALTVSNGINLNWITASETNNNYFTCERSQNGIDFYPLENIEGAGNSTTINKYDYLDIHPFNGLNYYRIKQTDFDGNYSYSETVAINCKISRTFKLYRLFVDDYKQLNLSLQNTNNEIQINIYDVSGRVVYVRGFHIQDTDNTLTIPLEGICSGSYMLIITNGSEKICENFILGN